MRGEGNFSLHSLGIPSCGDFSCELQLPPESLRCSCSSLAHMEPFLKIPNRALLAELATLLTPRRNIAEHHQKPKNSPLKSPPASSKLTRRHTRTKKQRGEVKFNLRPEFCLLGTEKVLSHLSEVFKREGSFLSLEEIME